VISLRYRAHLIGDCNLNKTSHGQNYMEKTDPFMDIEVVGLYSRDRHSFLFHKNIAFRNLRRSLDRAATDLAFHLKARDIGDWHRPSMFPTICIFPILEMSPGLSSPQFSSTLGIHMVAALAQNSLWPGASVESNWARARFMSSCMNRSSSILASFFASAGLDSARRRSSMDKRTRFV